MDTIFALLACCLLVLSLPAAQMGNLSTTVTPSPGLNLTLETTKSASSNSAAHVTVISELTEHTAPDTSTDVNEKLNNTAATTESTSQHQTSQAATSLKTLTNATLMTTTQSTPTSAFTNDALSSATESGHTATQGVHLNVSETSMTIIFSSVLVLFVVALVIIMFHKCKHKIQYLHQPLNDADDTGGFMADEDTLVISGGLYDGHPIYDNVPPVPADQSQFRLQFIH